MRHKIILIALLIVMFHIATDYKSVQAKEYYEKLGVMTTSWYGYPFDGRRTANGERFNKQELTAAHKTLPFNTVLKLTNLKNNKQITVRINDRGPYIKGRSLDVSEAAAESLGMKHQGIAKLTVYKVVKIDTSKNKKY